MQYLAMGWLGVRSQDPRAGDLEKGVPVSSTLDLGYVHSLLAGLCGSCGPGSLIPAVRVVSILLHFGGSILGSSEGIQRAGSASTFYCASPVFSSPISNPFLWSRLLATCSRLTSQALSQPDYIIYLLPTSIFTLSPKSHFYHFY